MWWLDAEALDFADAWLASDPAARWRSAAGHGPATGASASGSSVLEVEEGCLLPRHTDSAEETIVVLSGRAEVTVATERATVDAPGILVVPQQVPHLVRNAGAGTLRFVAVYAATAVVTRYEEEVQPDGERERTPVE